MTSNLQELLRLIRCGQLMSGGFVIYRFIMCVLRSERWTGARTGIANIRNKRVHSAHTQKCGRDAWLIGKPRRKDARLNCCSGRAYLGRTVERDALSGKVHSQFQRHLLACITMTTHKKPMTISNWVLQLSLLFDARADIRRTHDTTIINYATFFLSDRTATVELTPRRRGHDCIETSGSVTGAISAINAQFVHT